MFNERIQNITDMGRICFVMIGMTVRDVNDFLKDMSLFGLYSLKIQQKK